MYSTSYQLIFYLSLPAYSLLIVGIPVISELWLGSYENIFIISAVALSIGWGVNTLSAPAYFSNMGTGELRWNVAAHLIMVVMNAVLGSVFGLFFGGTGVIMAWVSALATGSVMILASYHHKHHIELPELFPMASRLTMAVCMAGIFVTRLISVTAGDGSRFFLNSTLTFLFAIIITVFLWIHPMRKRIFHWIGSALLNKKSAEQNA